MLSCLLRYHAEQVAGIGMSRVNADDGSVQRLCLLQMALLVETDCSGHSLVDFHLKLGLVCRRGGRLNHSFFLCHIC